MDENRVMPLYITIDEEEKLVVFFLIKTFLWIKLTEWPQKMLNKIPRLFPDFP